MNVSTEAMNAFRTACQKVQIKPKIGFIGGGNMAQAMAKGILKSGILSKSDLAFSDPNCATLEAVKQLGCSAFSSNVDLLRSWNDSIVIVAVKPDILATVLSQLQQLVPSSFNVALMLSVVAGASLAQLTFAEKLPVIRVMPNTPALVGVGASAFTANQNCDANHKVIAQALLGTCGIVEEIAEYHMDAVCGLSGSGPAFVYMVIEAMSDGAVKMGLPRSIANRFAAQTVLGSGMMALETGLHPGQLKELVTSPAGTTITGVHVLEAAGVRNAFMSAVEAATKRSKELSKIEK